LKDISAEDFAKLFKTAEEARRLKAQMDALRVGL
jgi:hypothetical protein